jgi:hypothetical protein
MLGFSTNLGCKTIYKNIYSNLPGFSYGATRIADRACFPHKLIKFRSLKLLFVLFVSQRQNGVAERWVGNCRRDLLDHAIVLNEGI